MALHDNSSTSIPFSSLLESGTHKQKRARGQLSCTLCRVGKLKCNRVRDPACDQCLKRGREASCQYVTPPSKAKPVANVKGRIRQLESLVKDLMVQQHQAALSSSTPSTNAQSSSPSSDDVLQEKHMHGQSSNGNANVERSLGQLDINREEIAYTGGAHWQTILSSLSDIQKDLGEVDVQDREDEDLGEVTAPDTRSPSHVQQENAASQRDFLLGSVRPMTREQLIKAIPDKKTTDRLLSLWFNSPDPFKIIIHAPTFQEEYKRFWRDQNAPTMWVGLLFAILCLAESFGLRNSVPGSPLASSCRDQALHYQSLTASAAVLAEYTKPKKHTIECLLLYMVSLRSDNAAMNAWLVMGIIVRLALRMGYHRDPGHYTKLDAFDSEMRRRVWGMTHMIDILMSFQLGLPSMVRTVAADTLPPTNLLDRDIAPSMAYLPAGRGENELTPSSYTRAKLRLIHVFSEAVELSHATIPPRHDVVDRLNRDLETAKQDIPAALQMPDMSELVTDPAEQLMCRFNLDLLYLKTKIVLFRRYMLVPIAELSEQEQHKGIGAGREACIKSARRVLDHHHTIYNAIQPGGQLENMRWYMGSIAIHDFLLAAMVICLELSQQLQKDKMLRISNGMLCPTRQAMLRALQSSHDIWVSTAGEYSSTLHNDQGSGYKGGDMYQETTRASKAMAAMLARIKAQDSDNTVEDVLQSSPQKTNIFLAPDDTYFGRIGLTPAGSRAIRAQGEPFHGVVSSYQWNGVPEDFQFSSVQQSSNSITKSTAISQAYSNGQSGAGSISNLNTEGGDPMNIDWQAWENEIFNMDGQEDIDWQLQQDFGDAPQMSSFDRDGLSWQQESLQRAMSHNTSDMHFSLEDMAGLDIDSTVYTPFIDNNKKSVWPMNTMHSIGG